MNVLRGSSALLTDTNNQIWSQDSTNIQGSPFTSDYFGTSLAAGDFNNDGYDDLAIGVPNEHIHTGTERTGAVNVLRGSSVLLTDSNSQIWWQDSAGEFAESDDDFGASLVVGDFNNNGRTDLAIGVIGEDIDGIADAGAVNVLYSN